jgi:hypothetical protein
VVRRSVIDPIRVEADNREADNRTPRMEKEVLQGEAIATDHRSMTEADAEGSENIVPATS